MSDRAKPANPKRFHRVLLAIGTASSALCFASPALAACVLAPGGTGTVANPGPNSTVVCTGTTTGIDIGSIGPGAEVQLEGGAQVNGVAGSEIYLDGSNNRITIGGGSTPGPAILSDANIVVIGDNAGLFLVDGSQIQSPGQPLNQVIVEGAGARLHIGPGSQIFATRPVRLSGGGASFGLEPFGQLYAGPSFTGSALILGGATSEVYQLGGRFEVLGNNSVATVLDAGDGDDIISLGPNTVFADIAGPGSTSTFVLNGGGGDDKMYLDGSNFQGPFSSVGIENLVTAFGPTDNWTLQGTHEFQSIQVTSGTLTALGDAALGVPGSNINILADGRLVYAGGGQLPFAHNLFGDGTFEFSGSANFDSANSGFTGTFLVSGGEARFSHDQAFGSADVVVSAGGFAVLQDVTIANTLSGNGAYYINGTSTTLTGTNAMTGIIAINTGALVVSNLAALGNGQVSTPASITLLGSLDLNLDQLGGGVLDNDLSGTGTLNKALAGNLTINRSNPNFSGQVNLLGGRVLLSATDALGTGTIHFGGAIMDFTNTADILVANAITGNSVFEKNGPGRTTLTGNNSGMTALFALNQGVVAVSSVTGFGTGGNANLGGTSGLEINNSADETLGLRITNVIPSVGTFRKLGAGRLTIGDLFQVGTLAIDAGTLRVNQTITAANATVASGARLDGTGRIIGNAANNGTVAPGNSIGTLTVQGNYVHNANSVLEIEFNGSGGIDLLAVTGTATINGGTLRFVSLGGAEGSGGTFLTAAGGVAGTFATVETVGAQLPLAVIYQTNSANMAPSVLTARPSTFNAQFLAASDGAFSFVDRVTGAAASGAEGKRLWMQGFGSDGNRSASGTTLGYGHNGHGIAGGIVLPLGGNASLGAAVGWSRSNIELASGGGSGEQDAVLGSLHLRYAGQGFALEGGALYGSVDQQTLRNVSFNGFSASVSGATNSNVYGGFLGADAELAKLGDWGLAASARASLMHQAQDGFTESDTSPLRLAVPDLASDTLEVQGGLGITRKLGAGELRFDLGARLVDNLGDRTMPVTFAASAAGVTLQGDTRSSVHGYAGAALDLPLSDSVLFTLGYAGQLGQTDRHEGRIGLSIGF